MHMPSKLCIPLHCLMTDTNYAFIVLHALAQEAKALQDAAAAARARATAEAAMATGSSSTLSSSTSTSTGTWSKSSSAQGSVKGINGAAFAVTSHLDRQAAATRAGVARGEAAVADAQRWLIEVRGCGQL